jgi:hypothetical protein
VIQGGTGAEDAPTARTNLGAAASGINSDITALNSITAASVTSGQAGISITSNGGSGNAVVFNNGSGGASGGFTTDARGFLNSLTMSGGLICGSVQVSGNMELGQISNAVPGQPVNVAALLQAGFGVVIEGSTPSAAAGQIGIGAQVAATASDGGGQAVPGHVMAYLIVNNQGTLGKIPIFAV